MQSLYIFITLRLLPGYSLVLYTIHVQRHCEITGRGVVLTNRLENII